MNRMDDRMDRFERQAEADRQAVNTRMDHMDERMLRFEQQAETDRQAMSSRMDRFEQAMNHAVDRLTDAVINVNTRLVKVEDRPNGSAQ